MLQDCLDPAMSPLGSLFRGHGVGYAFPKSSYVVPAWDMSIKENDILHKQELYRRLVLRKPQIMGAIGP